MSQENTDSRLTPLDWFAAIVCAPVGCVVGLFYLVNGNPKAGKMLLVSIVVSVVLNVIGIVATGFGALK
jgi:hypothetical protein